MYNLKHRADEVMAHLTALPQVQKVTLYGSVAAGTYDVLSDIDIEVDVSGYDNGRFALDLPALLSGRLPILYADYAPSLAPDKYIVTLSIDEQNPFLTVDLDCVAVPHCSNVLRQELSSRNTLPTHTLKVWTANLKHFCRGIPCRRDIERMAGRLGIEDIPHKSELTILGEVLHWLEVHSNAELGTYLQSCRAHYAAYLTAGAEESPGSQRRSQVFWFFENNA